MWLLGTTDVKLQGIGNSCVKTGRNGTKQTSDSKPYASQVPSFIFLKNLIPPE
jgi:hypothetical protein